MKLESNFLQSSDRPFCNSRGKLYSQLSTQATPVILTLLLQASAGNINAQSPAFPCSTRTPQYCAGAVNPIAKPGDATIYPIKGVLAFAPGPAGSNATTMPTFVNKNGSLAQNPNPWSVTPFQADTTYVAAAGKIIAPGTSSTPNAAGGYGYPEDVVYASVSNNSIQVQFANPAHQQYNVQLNPEPWDGTQIPSLGIGNNNASIQYLAIATGDLDGAVDSNGETHDEVVVAFPVVDSSGTWKIELFVLNYADTTGAPAINENNTIHSACGIGCFTTPTSFTNQKNQNTMLPAGNILSLAIGDFDGDGQNEISLAHIGNGNDLYVTIFRYRNPGKYQSPTLTALYDYDQSSLSTQSSNPASYIGSVSLVAGDFNNDGKDELAVGYEEWQKNSSVAPGVDGLDKYQCVLYEGSFNVPTKLVEDVCDYRGYSISYMNYVTVYASSLGSAAATSVAPGSQPGTTTIMFPNANTLLSGYVYISGATGSWSALNGYWPVIYADGTQFSIALDSASFGAFPANTSVTVSTTAPLTAGGTYTLNPRIDNPGAAYNANVANLFDLRDSNSWPTIQLLSGLFEMSTSNPTAFHQRQILAVWSTPAPADSVNLNLQYTPLPYWPYDLVSAYLNVSTDGKNTPTLSTYASLQGHQYTSGKYGYAHQRFSLTASNFFGATEVAEGSSAPPPTWQFALGSLFDNGGYDVRIGQINSGAIKINQDVNLPNGIAANYEASGQLPVVAYDPDGSSYFLGAPIHFQTSNFNTPVYILQEPPKHIAWLNGTIKNVNRYNDTASAVKIDNTTTDGTSSTTTNGYDIANSIKVSGEATLQEGNPQLVGESVSISDSLALGYERTSSTQKLSLLSTTTEFQANNSSPNDDYLEYSSSTNDVWRYRLYGGAPPADGSYKFYEVVVPGQTVEFHGGGLQADWYNPQHENGNILSYPPPLPLNMNPPDVGPAYKVDGVNVGSVTSGVMWNANSYCFGETASQNTLNITGLTSSSKTVDTNNTMSQDNEFQAGEKTSAFGFSTSLNFDWTFGAKESWASSNTTNNSTTTGTSFSFNLGTGDNTFGYSIAPTLYSSFSGAIKMTYTVNIPSNTNQVGNCTSNNWTTYYGQQDPGLMLPWRWNNAGEDPTSGNTIFQLEPSIQREQLKSFFLESPNPNSVETTDPNNPVYDKLASVPVVGTVVRLSVPVYNFSVGTNAIAVGVQFSTIPVDQNNDEVGCGTPKSSPWVCPNSYRSPLMDGATGQPLAPIQIPSIPFWNTSASTNSVSDNWRTAATTWTIPQSMATSSPSGTKYRIYVNVIATGTETNPPQAACSQVPCPTLCPLNTQNCTDTTLTIQDPLAPGQNNEGWSYITVAPVSLSAVPNAHPNVYTSDESLVVVGKHRSWKGIALGYLNRSMQLRVQALADLTDNRYHTMTVTDQTFANTQPEVIASKILQGVATQGTSETFNWTPQMLGIHQLTAQVNQYADDTQPGNNTAQLLVLVIPAPGDVNGDGFVDSADLAIMQHDLGKPVQQSACGYACDLNGDGYITEVDEDLAMSMCSRDHCAAVGSGPAKSISMSAVRELYQKQLAQIRNLKPADRAALLSQVDDAGSSASQILYLKSLLRLSAASQNAASRKGGN